MIGRTEGLFFAELGGVKPTPRSDLVYRGIELCRKEGIDFILAEGRAASAVLSP